MLRSQVERTDSLELIPVRRAGTGGPSHCAEYTNMSDKEMLAEETEQLVAEREEGGTEYQLTNTSYHSYLVLNSY